MTVPNQGPRLQSVAILFLTLSWIAVSLRCYVRAGLMKSFGSDDWLMLASLSLFTVFTAFGFLCIRDGGGKHITDIPINEMVTALKWWWLAEIFYVISTGMLKFSISAFLLRLTVKRSHFIIIWAVMLVVALMTTSTAALVIFQCHPVPHFWTRYNGSEGTCIAMRIVVDIAWVHSITNCCADWILATLPVFMVWSLDMNPRTKLSLAIILALGALGSSATIIRCIYVKGLAEDDFLWQTVGISIWSIVEVGIGATAASLATLRPLFVRFFSRSHLFRGSETLPSTFPRGPSPPTNISVTKSGLSNWRRSCVIESSSPTKPDALTVELSLREDVRKGHGVTTVINSDWKDQSEKEMAIEDNGEAPVHRSLRRYRGDRGSHSGRRGLLRSLSQTGLREPEEAIISPTWGESGIRKTMVVTTDSELGDQVPGTAL